MNHREVWELMSSALSSSVRASSTVRVAVVDDHESVRLGLKSAFIDEGYEFVLAAATVQELVDGLAGRECDVVVLDLSLGDGSSVTDDPSPRERSRTTTSHSRPASPSTSSCTVAAASTNS